MLPTRAAVSLPTTASDRERSMSGNKARLQAIDAVKGYRAPAAIFPTADAPGEIFGQNVFTKTVMQQRLAKPVFKS
jgi:glutamine synthetase